MDVLYISTLPLVTPASFPLPRGGVGSWICACVFRCALRRGLYSTLHTAGGGQLNTSGNMTHSPSPAGRQQAGRIYANHKKRQKQSAGIHGMMFGFGAVSCLHLTVNQCDLLPCAALLRHATLEAQKATARAEGTERRRTHNKYKRTLTQHNRRTPATGHEDLSGGFLYSSAVVVWRSSARNAVTLSTSSCGTVPDSLYRLYAPPCAARW